MSKAKADTKPYVMRYMGSKINLLDFIVPLLEEMLPAGDGFLDLMAGTHAVGYAMKPKHPIIASDIQEYSRIIGVARIENNSIQLTATDLETDILARLQPDPDFHLFETYYADTYFSPQQCAEIDMIRAAISKVEGEIEQALYLTALIFAMGYAQSSPGHFAQYMPKDHPRLESLRKLSVIEAFKKKVLEDKIVFSKYRNQSLAQDYRELLDDSELIKDVKLIYVDPPYSEAQYSRFYHLLETMVKYDYPELKHKGLYRGGRFQSNFGYKSKALGEFEYIASKAKETGASLAISYSDRGLVPLEKISGMLKQYYPKVAVHKQKYSHSMQGRGMVKELHEVLITAQES